jgi:hypothetical protein
LLFLPQGSQSGDLELQYIPLPRAANHVPVTDKTITYKYFIMLLLLTAPWQQSDSETAIK